MVAFFFFFMFYIVIRLGFLIEFLICDECLFGHIPMSMPVGLNCRFISIVREGTGAARDPPLPAPDQSHHSDYGKV